MAATTTMKLQMVNGGSSKPKFVEDLEEKGYAVIEGVLNEGEVDEARREFFKWLDSSEQMRRMHRKARTCVFDFLLSVQ